MDPQRHEEAVTLLDSLAPVQGGRPWRVVRCTEDHLYESYVKRLAVVHPSQRPVSKSYFIEHVLDKKHNLVHHESSPDFCVLCHKREELVAKKQAGSLSAEEEAELEELEQHYVLQATQWSVYHEIMAQLEHDPALRLIVQDFNQQQSNSLEMQVLSIVLYEASNGSINRHYYHYLLPPGVKNDILAVIACHRLFFKEPLVQQANELSFWSDGWPKHFKLTANLAHMWALAASMPHTKITLNFFASYHGSGPSDAAAAHLSRAIKNETRNCHWVGNDVDEVAARLREITDPATTQISPVSVPADLQKVSIETAHGMKKSHKFTFHSDWVVCGWPDSRAHAPTQVWQLAFLEDTSAVL